jgi:hypothetical protein
MTTGDRIVACASRSNTGPEAANAARARSTYLRRFRPSAMLGSPAAPENAPVLTYKMRR